MPGPTYELGGDTQFHDLFKTVHPQVLGKTPRLTNLAQAYPRNIFAKLLANKARHYSVTGHSFDWPMLVDYGSGIRYVHWAAEDAVSMEDNVRIASEKLVHATWNVAWFRQEMLMAASRGATKKQKGAKVFDLMRSRMIQRQQGVIADGEERLWGTLTQASEAETYPKSVPYWIQKAASGEGPGFVGGNPAGFSAGRGLIDSDTYVRAKNYAGHYAQVSDDDLLDRMREMEMDIRFEKPEAIVDPAGALELPDPVYYAGKDLILAFRKLMRSNRENITDSAGPEVMFNRKTIEYVPYLDQDASDPLYALDTRDLKVAYLPGDMLHLTGPLNLESQHNGYVQHWDLSYQVFCSNLRLHGVLSKDV